MFLNHRKFLFWEIFTPCAGGTRASRLHSIINQNFLVHQEKIGFEYKAEIQFWCWLRAWVHHCSHLWGGHSKNNERKLWQQVECLERIVSDKILSVEECGEQMVVFKDELLKENHRETNGRGQQEAAAALWGKHNWAQKSIKEESTKEGVEKCVLFHGLGSVQIPYLVWNIFYLWAEDRPE